MSGCGCYNAVKTALAMAEGQKKTPPSVWLKSSSSNLGPYMVCQVMVCRSILVAWEVNGSVALGRGGSGSGLDVHTCRESLSALLLSPPAQYYTLESNICISKAQLVR